MTNKKNSSWISITFKVLKRIKLRTLLLLGLTLSFNSFAWFIYATKISSGVTAHVRSWNVSFEVGDGEAVEYVNFDVSDIYPGMTTYTDTLTAYNNGEADATLSYELVSAKILGTTYTVDDITLTHQQLETQLATIYPFSIAFSVSDTIVSPGTNATFSLSVSWPYEAGDDEEDTYWGNLSYAYSNTVTTLPSIEIVVKVRAVQS